MCQIFIKAHPLYTGLILTYEAFTYISLSFLRVDMVLSAIVIALTTLLFSIGGLFIGHYIGNKLQKYAEVIGGVILIALGIKICIEHLFFS